MLNRDQPYDRHRAYRVGDRAIFAGVLREAIPKPGSKGLLWRKVRPSPARGAGYNTREIMSLNTRELNAIDGA